MNSYYATQKQWIKAATQVIKAMRYGKKPYYLKPEEHGFDPVLGAKVVSYWTLRHEFRHRHIALSLFRGKTREQIERPADNNLPNETKIAE